MAETEKRKEEERARRAEQAGVNMLSQKEMMDGFQFVGFF